MKVHYAARDVMPYAPYPNALHVQNVLIWTSAIEKALVAKETQPDQSAFLLLKKTGPASQSTSAFFVSPNAEVRTITMAISKAASLLS